MFVSKAPGELVAIFDHGRAKVAAILLLAFGGSNAMLVLLKDGVQRNLFTINQAIIYDKGQQLTKTAIDQDKLTWWRTRVRAALQVKSQPGSLQLCSPWFQFKMFSCSKLDKYDYLIRTFGTFFVFLPLYNGPLHEIAYQLWFSLCTRKTEEK